MKTYVQNGDGTETFVAMEDGKLITGTGSYVAHAIADNAKRLHNEGYHGSSDMKHAARVDPVMIEAYLNRMGITYHEFACSQSHMKAFLMQPEISAFRIWPGKL